MSDASGIETAKYLLTQYERELARTSEAYAAHMPVAIASEYAEAAIRICHTCPHISDCLRFALSMSDNPEGIWGGMTRRQRSALRR